MKREGAELQARKNKQMFSQYWRERLDEYWLMRLVKAVGDVVTVLLSESDHTLEHELEQIESIAGNWLDLCRRRDKGEECYLPITCPVCNRQRLLFSPGEGSVMCEKCGADAETINAEIAEIEERVGLKVVGHSDTR